MHEHPNSLLKVGCLLFIVGGLASALVTLAGLLLSVGSMMDSELYPYVDQMARAQSDGLIGGDEIMAVFSGFVFVRLVFWGSPGAGGQKNTAFSWVGESHCWSSAVLAPC